MQLKIFFLSISILFSLSGFINSSSVFAETLYVKKSGTKLQAEASAKSRVVRELAQGTAAEVQEKADKFYKVKADGAEGFVFKFLLTPKKPEAKDAGGGLLDILGGDSKIAAKEATSASSIRGLSPMSEEHAKKKGISKEDIEAVKRMEDFQVSAGEVDQFLAQRKLGPYGE